MAFALGLLGALSSIGLGAQEPPPIESYGASIDVRVVNVEAVIMDAKGSRVRGLSAGDFRLLVDGRETPIEYFTEVEQGRALAAGPAAPVGPQAPLAAGEEVGRSYLIYLDDSFSLANMRNGALERLERDLTLLRPADRMAVLAFDGSRIEVLSGWTGDTAALAAALERARRRPAEGIKQLVYQRALQSDACWLQNDCGLGTGAVPVLADGDTNPLTNSMDRVMESFSNRISPEARTQTGRTAAAVAAVLRSFEVPPGRKMLLLFSSASTLSVAPQLYGSMIEAANRQGYTIYPVDLAQSSPYEMTALHELAGKTGGRLVASMKLDILPQVAADADSYYWLGFSPSWKADDGTHQVTVEPRRAGLAVRARGFFSDPSKRTDAAAKAESVLLFGGAARDRRLIVRLGEPKKVGRGQLEVPVTLGVPVESLALTPQGEGYVAEMPLAIVAMDGEGGRADLPPSHLEVALKTPPKTGAYARFQTAVRVRDVGQRLVFSVQDPVNGTAIWGEAEYAPRTGQPSVKR